MPEIDEDEGCKVTVEFELPVPEGATYDEVREWVIFNLCGGTMKNEVLKRMGDFEPDPWSVSVDY